MKNRYFLLTLYILILLSRTAAQPSRIELKSLYSPTLASSKEFNILFPEGYDNETDRYPVVYLFRGAVDEWADPTEDAARRGNIKTVVDSLFAKRKIGKMIYIMPGLGAPAPQNEYTYLVNDLIPYVDSHFRTIPDRWHRAMDGFSLGGLITTNLLSAVPHLFSSIGSYDGTLSLFDNTKFSAAGSSLIYSIKQVQLLYHTGSVGATNNSNNQTTFAILNSKGIFNSFPSFTLNANAQHNWYYADLHMAVTLPLHWGKMQSAANALHLLIKDSVTGKTFSGQTSINWSRTSFPNSIATYLFYSDDNGSRWNQIHATSGNDSSVLWNTSSVKDGTRYRLKMISAGDSLFGETQTGRFTVNNPGNAAPDIEFIQLNGRDTLSGDHHLQWLAADADGDAITVSIEISYNSGLTWKTIASSLPNNGGYAIDTRSLPNGDNVLIRLTANDGLSSNSISSSSCIIYNKRFSLLNAAFIHQSGISDARLHAVGISKEQIGTADYLISFKDSSGKKSYSVTDGNGITVLNNASELDGKTEGPLFNGFRLLITDIPSPVINADSSRWIIGTSSLTGEIKLIDINLDNQTITALPFASDYEIRLTNSIADTSLGLFGASPLPVNFYVWNKSLNQKTKFIFVELDGNGILSRNDELYLFEKDSLSQFFLSWHIIFSGNENAAGPIPGDVFSIRVMKPLTAKDSYRFLYTPSSVRSIPSTFPDHYSLSQNYPNPFNPATTIEFTIPKEDIVNITVFDLLGKTVAGLVNGKLPAGSYSITWKPQQQSSGMYFYRLSSGNVVRTMKMLLLK